MFQYEKSSELDQEEISVHDIDNPDTVKRLPVNMIILIQHVKAIQFVGTAV